MNKQCKTCKENKPIEDFTITKYKGETKRRPVCRKCTTNRVKEWVNNNKEKRKQYVKEYSETNKVQISKKSRDYYYENKEQVIPKTVLYKKNRRKKDNLFRLTENIRKAITKSFYLKGTKKNSKTTIILGCSFQEFKTHIESKFEPWMNWENYGTYNGELNYGWDLDHITPISSAINEGDLIKLNHFTNFQPLCSYINRHIKREKI